MKQNQTAQTGPVKRRAVLNVLKRTAFSLSMIAFVTAVSTATTSVAVVSTALAAPAVSATDRETENECSRYSPPPVMRLLKELPLENPCAGRGTSLVALTDIQVLFSCRNGQPVANYDFALGFNGIDKRRNGDLRTPIGTYSIARGRESADFGVFLNIGYPTPQQKKQGFTGSAVGLHGPKRATRCAGFLNVTFNWTRGCLAVASDGFIGEIADFVAKNRVDLIHIIPPAEEEKWFHGPRLVPSGGPAAPPADSGNN